MTRPGITPASLASAAQTTAAFGWRLRVYWEDTDAGDVVYYANYLKFFERARTEWLRAKGIEQQRLRLETDAAFVVSQLQVHYHQSARLDDELFVTVSASKVGGASLYIHQQAWLQHNTPAALRLCEANVRLGWVGANGKPGRIPSFVLNKLL